jgi:hypothetical protein
MPLGRIRRGPAHDLRAQCWHGPACVAHVAHGLAGLGPCTWQAHGPVRKAAWALARARRRSGAASRGGGMVLANGAGGGGNAALTGYARGGGGARRLLR